MAQIAKARTELDERKAKVVTLEALVVRQSKALRAETVKFREVRAEVITARATQSHAPDTVWCDRVHGFKWLPLLPSSALGRWPPSKYIHFRALKRFTITPTLLIIDPETWSKPIYN